MAMELDSMWDEGFFSMLNEDLDYEFDENDLFKNPCPEDHLQGAIKNEDFKELSIFAPKSDCHSTYYEKKALVQAEHERLEPETNANFSLKNQFELPDLTSYSSFTQDPVNVTPTSNASYGFVDRGNLIKTEMKRRDSVDSDIVNTDQPIIIDARIFLDPYNRTKEHEQVVPTSFISGNTGKLNSTESLTCQNQSEKLVKSKKSINPVAHKSSKTNGSGNVKISQKSNNKRMKLRDCAINDDGRKCDLRKEKVVPEKANKKRKYSSDSQNEKLISLKDKNATSKCEPRKEKVVPEKAKKNRKYSSDSDSENISLKDKNATLKTGDKERQVDHSNDKRAKSKYSSRDKKHKCSHEPLNIKTESNQIKNESSVDSNIDKQRNKIRTSTTSDTEKNKRVRSDRSALDRKCKIGKVQIDVGSNVGLSHSAKKKDINTLELEPNVTSDVEKEIVDVKQSSLKLNLKTEKPNVTSVIKKEIVDVKQSSLKLKTEKLSENKEFSETPDEQEYPSERKRISIVKPEYGHLANLKVESKWKQFPLEPKIVLKKLSDYIIDGLPVCTEFRTPKEEILDQKSNIRLNPFHLPKARIVLKNLNNGDLTSSERLLSRVKSEMNASIARKLKSQGRARDRQFIHRFCCKCKSFQIDRDGLSKTKYCDSCGFQLIYLCAKCNEKHYVDYNHAFRHFKFCQGSGETKGVGLDSIVLHRCTECTFKTTHTKIMIAHVKSKGHKADGELDIDKVLKCEKDRVKREGKGKNEDAKSKGKDSKRGGKDAKPEDMPKLPRNKYAKLIVNQNKTRTADVTERYCTKCNKPHSSKTRKGHESCDKCNVRLQLNCLKCQQKCISYDVMLKHLRSACCPNSYRCAKCNYEGSVWSLMQQHVWETHRNSSNRPSKSNRKKRESRKRCNDVFHCELCTFQTRYKFSLGRHVREVHKK